MKYKVTFKNIYCGIRCTPDPLNNRGIFTCLDCKAYDEEVENTQILDKATYLKILNMGQIYITKVEVI